MEGVNLLDRYSLEIGSLTLAPSCFDSTMEAHRSFPNEQLDSNVRETQMIELPVSIKS